MKKSEIRASERARGRYGDVIDGDDDDASPSVTVLFDERSCLVMLGTASEIGLGDRDGDGGLAGSFGLV